MTFLQDHFGTYWRPVASSETDSVLEIWVKCLPSAMALFVRQYMDRVRVLEPEDVAKKAEDTLRRDFKTYFLENFLEMRTIIVCKCAIYNIDKRTLKME